MKSVSRPKVEPPRLLLITPPFTQLNTPYPATAYLAGFLRSRDYPVSQADLSIETFLALFSRPGLGRLFDAIRSIISGGQCSDAEECGRLTDSAAFVHGAPYSSRHEPSHAPTPRARISKADGSLDIITWALMMEDRYLDTINPAIRYLQGADPSLATQICGRRFLPEGPRFADLEEKKSVFGTLGPADRAKHLASLYLDDLTDLIQATIDPRFGLSRYAERLAASAPSFDPLYAALKAPPGLIDLLLEEVLDRILREAVPDLVGITVPFPGNLYGALRAAAFIRRRLPGTRIILGGGYVNTELRELAEPRLFDYADYVTLDAGELPLLAILHAARTPDRDVPLCRTFVRCDGRVVYQNTAPGPEISFAETGTPTYRGLPLRRYISIVEMLNPMHRLWSDGRWNKLTVAHGCYWKKCAFCDVGLDYIQRYEPAPATLLADRIDALIEETGETGFHFVDEAAPPSRLVDLALELLDRGRVISWWGNIRFEESFSPDPCRLLAASGCIAVTGGMEVASDRLLSLMEKGIDVVQVARAAEAFTRAGIMVHAYLMYGFPSETVRETIESLERVRQFFEAGLLHSAFWHRFTATRHSPVGLNPVAYGITVTGPAPGPFANNDLTHIDAAGCDPERFGPGLAKAIYNYMHGVGLKADVRSFFDFPLPKPKVPKDFIRSALRAPSSARRGDRDQLDRRVIWLGGVSSVLSVRSGRASLLLSGSEGDWVIETETALVEWLASLIRESRPRGRKGAPFIRLAEAGERYPSSVRKSFGAFLGSREWKSVRAAGLILI
jgi:Radical SAM superfamily